MNDRQLKFEALVNAYSAELYRYAYWLTKQSSLAEDLVQETFLRAWRSLDSLREPEAAKSWLVVILRREMARHFAKSKELTSAVESEMVEHLTMPEPGLPMVDRLIVRQALGNLPVLYREPLLLQVLNGYSCEEIAEILGIKAGTVMTRLSRARQQLRNILAENTPQHKKYGEHT